MDYPIRLGGSNHSIQGLIRFNRFGFLKRIKNQRRRKRRMKITDHTTMYRNNSRNRYEFKDCSSLKLSCNLTEKHNAVGYIFFTRDDGN